MGCHPILAPDVLYQKTLKCNVSVSFYMWEAISIILNDDIHYGQLERTLLYRVLFLISFAYASGVMEGNYYWLRAKLCVL